ncbi:hybrid sensor histidine kinase/response regulator [Nostoc sp. CENA543]|uniref:hybrid sensor histidine kinase/response regulator n=1 Tax=Nostoc sp. CENA543 TaxID=1869241 RepID=UPI000CA29D08|nr:response regulator [Nostoc sp. CENA543]AUT01440.1 hybrid sensor histidine kinase/response regulator [Nostoc sp. CENA543]
MQPELKVNILLVDDKLENLLALEAVLERLGANLVRATTGEDALRCLLNQDFAVILLDVQMPGMDGFETATMIRSRGRSRQTPIIFLTAFSSNEQMLFKGYALGAVDYLLKPIESHILLSKVTVFVELFKKTQAVQRQAAQLTAMNAELRQSEERFRCLSTCSPVGIFETDTEGHCKYTNPRYQAICGLSAVDTLHTKWIDSVHLEDRARAVASWNAYIQQGGDYSEEFQFYTHDGSLRWVQVRSSPMLSNQGELLGYVGTLEDITARKQAEEIRAQVIREQTARQEAEATNRMKDEFLAVLSHELRTPLTAMLGWSKILRAKKLDATATARALEAIERNANTQVQLIEDILDVSRIIRGQLRLNLCAVNPVSVIEAALEVVRPLADTKDIELHTFLNMNLGSVCGDPSRLQQIVWNLLTNAIKFTPQGGKVEVHLTGIELERTEQENQKISASIPVGIPKSSVYAQIQVIDTGIGITPEFLPKVFERFRQADSTTTRSHSGLGLGLAIVRHLVELHGGIITADSPGEGQGAIFTVQLPLIGANQENVNQPQEVNFWQSSTPLQGVKVLIVDDEIDTCNLLVCLLEESGAIAHAANSTEAALAILEESQPDILITDLAMSDSDGYSFIHRLRNLEAHQGGNIPAIALTACSPEAASPPSIPLGFQQHLFKPIESDKLIATVINLLEKTAVGKM